MFGEKFNRGTKASLFHERGLNEPRGHFSTRVSLRGTERVHDPKVSENSRSVTVPPTHDNEMRDPRPHRKC